MAAIRCALALLVASVIIQASFGAEVRGRIAKVDLDKNEFVFGRGSIRAIFR